MITKVIFRMLEGQPLALFPELPGDMNPYVTCLSYQHMGQHGAACVNLTSRYTTPASEDQYRDLLAELVSIGYDDLKIVKRRSITDLVKRIDACKV
jgi:hypothetical protein